MSSTIVIKPEPPTQGQTCTLCIEPPQSGVTLTCEFTDAPDEEHVTGAGGCVDITIPDTASAMAVSGGGAPAATTPIRMA